MSDTKVRLLNVSADLFRRQGLAATGIKQVLSQAHAPFSSLYHHFPGGKVELAANVIQLSGARYQELVESVWDDAPDVVSGVDAVFDGAAKTLVATDYDVACPIATIALEVAGTNDVLRIATSDVFDSWIASGTERLESAGIPAEAARNLAMTLIALLEGAFILCQAAKSTEPMVAAGSVACAAVKSVLVSADQN
jgi:AcrR family transcriptional regulator